MLRRCLSCSRPEKDGFRTWSIEPYSASDGACRLRLSISRKRDHRHRERGFRGNSSHLGCLGSWGFGGRERHVVCDVPNLVNRSRDLDRGQLCVVKGVHRVMELSP